MLLEQMISFSVNFYQAKVLERKKKSPSTPLSVDVLEIPTFLSENDQLDTSHWSHTVFSF